jgi:hypothetical protein
LLQWLESHPVDWLVVEQMRIECAR